MKIYTLDREQVIARPLDETFAFFSDAFNLELLTPRFLRFRILNRPPVEMAAGTLLHYSLALFGVRLRWETLIEEWTPRVSFVDVQLKGPYAMWRHTHSFEARDPGHTLMRDHVKYAIPLGPVGRLAHALFVAGTLDKIFDYRAEQTSRLLDAPPT